MEREGEVGREKEGIYLGEMGGKERNTKERADSYKKERLKLSFRLNSLWYGLSFTVCFYRT